MTDVFTPPDDGGDLKSSDFSTSMTDRLGAQWADTLDPKDSLSGMWIGRQIAQGIAAGNLPHDYDVGADADSAMRLNAMNDQAKAAIPDVSHDDAQDMLKQEGLTDQDVHLGDAPTHKLPVLKMQIAEAHTRRDRQAAIERGPQGFFPDALGAVTSIGVGMIDPVNAAAFSIPVIGEARMGKIIASAGDSILARGAARFGQGAAQGAAGTAVLQPAEWWLHTRDGQDYTMAQAMQSVIMGAGMGGAFHAGFGAVGDIRNRARGLPLEGSPQDLLLRGLMTGTHVHADQLAEEGVPLEDVPGISPDAGPGSSTADPGTPLPPSSMHPAEALADLPPAAREDAVHAAMADIIAGRPTQAAEVLNIAADHDPRIAESIDAWHGSPHNFDQFDMSKVGTGEGAQTYGHGLYFAENEDVAKGYHSKLAGGQSIPDDVLAEYFKPGEIISGYGGSRDKVIAFNKETGDVTVRSVGADGEPSKDLLGLRNRTHHTMPELRELNAEFRRRGLPEYTPGGFYKVRINADQDHLLDWDKPISQQSPHVRSALQKVADDIIVRDPTDADDIMHAINADEGVDTFYERLADALKTMKKTAPDQNGFYTFDRGHAAASKILHEAGIPGIKYLDQGSRHIDRKYQLDGKPINLEDPAQLAAYSKELHPHGDDAIRNLDIDEPVSREAQQLLKDGAALPKLTDANPRTRNFVVFDDKHIEITHKNGELVKREDLAAEHEMQRAKAKGLRGRAAADPRTWSLFEYLASKGGLKPDPELRAIFGNDKGPFVPGFGPLIRKSGAALDQALTRAKEGGYLIDPNDLQHVAHTQLDAAQMRNEASLTLRDLLDRIDDESRGQKVYRPDHVQTTKYDPEQEKHVIMGTLEHELDASGARVQDIDPDLLDRTVAIVKRDGETDVLAAYERAIMEDAERYDAITNERRSIPETGHIPGWDASHSGTAPEDGASGAAERGQTARSEQGTRGEDGSQSSRPGRGDRSSPAVVAADPRWRQLADATPDFNEPEVLAESEEAARVPEPASVDPAKSLTAIEKAAQDAEEVWRQLEPTLTDEERRAINDVFASQQVDKATRDQIIVDGAACLMGAFA